MSVRTFTITAAQAERWGCHEYIGFAAVARTGDYLPGVWVKVDGVEIECVAGVVAASCIVDPE